MKLFNYTPIIAGFFLLLQGCLEPKSEDIWDLDRVTTLNTIGYCRYSAMSGDLIFVAAGQGGVQIWNFAPLFETNSVPLLKTTLDIKNDLAVVKDINQVAYSARTKQLFALETYERPILIDYSNPDNPINNGQAMSEKTEEFRIIDEDLSFTIIAADEDDGIKVTVFDGFALNDSTVLYSPAANGDSQTPLNGRSSGIDIADSLLAVSIDQLGVALYKYQSPPALQTFLDSRDTEGNAISVTFHGNSGLFVASEEGGCYYFQIMADSLRFKDEGVRFANDLRVQQVSYYENMAALALGSQGIALFDITDPLHPESRGVYDIGHVYHTAFANGYLLAATRAGLQIFTIGI